MSPGERLIALTHEAPGDHDNGEGKRRCHHVVTAGSGRAGRLPMTESLHNQERLPPYTASSCADLTQEQETARLDKIPCSYSVEVHATGKPVAVEPDLMIPCLQLSI